MSYSLILCDIGGVIVEVASDRMVHQLAQLLGRSFEDVQQVIYHKELLEPFEIGRITPHQYYDGLRERLQIPWTYEQFVGVWNGIFTENRAVTSLLARLHPRHTLMALSNTNVLHVEHIRRHVPSLSILRDWVVSCEAGCRKPDPAIYQLALKRAGVPPNAAIYIDDRLELVEAGRQVGLTAIRFESSQQLERDLRAAGVEC